MLEMLETALYYYCCLIRAEVTGKLPFIILAKNEEQNVLTLKLFEDLQKSIGSKKIYRTLSKKSAYNYFLGKIIKPAKNLNNLKIFWIEDIHDMIRTEFNLTEV